MSSYSEVSHENKAVTAPYPYQNYIKPPSSIGSSTKGDATTITNNIKALEGYLDVLMSGSSIAQTTGSNPLGNKYFYNTGGTCSAPDGSTQPRYIYINNIPDGTIPLISSGTNLSFSGSKGLVPGIMEDLGYMDPTQILSAFDSTTECQEIKMDVVDNNNVKSSQSYYVNNDDIAKYNPCWFPNRTNPVTGLKCLETMATRKPYSVISNDIWLKTYMYGITALSCFILYSLIYKKK
jgi:hypothetical protein